MIYVVLQLNLLGLHLNKLNELNYQRIIIFKHNSHYHMLILHKTWKFGLIINYKEKK